MAGDIQTVEAPQLSPADQIHQAETAVMRADRVVNQKSNPTDNDFQTQEGARNQLKELYTKFPDLVSKSATPKL